jgi:nucleoside-diphosphate-sugar epimerase
MQIILTGASGFIGRAFFNAAQQRSIKIRSVFRNYEQTKNYDHIRNSCVTIPSIEADTDWSEALVDVDVVVHCAARVHVMYDATITPFDEFYKVNVAGTLNLARQSALAGVKRFVFLSSIKVNGEATLPGRAFSSYDVPDPKDAYGISKTEAEAGLRLLSLETGMEVVIIRPPLVYGPGVKGNFSSLQRWVARGLPLPLASATTNRRSLVGLDNLVDLILICVDHPKAANQTFLVSDGEDLSTADLLKRIGISLNRPAKLIPLPMSVLIMSSRLLGKSSIAQRLLGSLQVDISTTCTLLDWKPPFSVDEGLRRAVQERM